MKNLRNAYNDVKNEVKNKIGIKTVVKGPYTANATSKREKCGFLWLSRKTVWTKSENKLMVLSFNDDVKSYTHSSSGDGYFEAVQKGNDITLVFYAWK